MEALRHFTDWMNLGLELGLYYPTLRRISGERQDNTNECKLEMLVAWLQQWDNVPQNGVPSWTVLQAALRNIGEYELAVIIEVS